MNDLRRPPRPDASRHRKALPALCLSGGGYRAMLFHVGALRRLNEFGLLGAFDRISSVSGGSIAAATLALAWDDLAFDETTGVAAGFNQVESKLLDFAGTRLDARVIATGLVRPGRQIAEQVAAAYRNRLFGDASLQQLPVSPRFVICASNVGTGSLVRFARPYTADYRVGCREAPGQLDELVEDLGLLRPRRLLVPGCQPVRDRTPLCHRELHRSGVTGADPKRRFLREATTPTTRRFPVSQCDFSARHPSAVIAST